MSAKLATHAALALLISIWGTTWAAIRIGLGGLPPFTGIALRFAIAGLLLVGVGRLLDWPLGRGREVRRLWLLNALLAFSVSYGVVYWAEQWLPSGLAAVLFSTFPLFVALLAHFWLPGERLRPAATLGVIVGFLGVVVIFSEDLRMLGGVETRQVAALFLVSPIVSAVASVLVKKWGRGVHPLSLTAIPMLMTALLMGALAAVVEGGRGVQLDIASTLALLYLSICGTGVTFLLYFWLLERLPATRLSLITYGVPIVAVATGTLFLDETFTLRMALGTTLVLGGVVLAARVDRRRTRTNTRSGAPRGSSSCADL